MTLQIHRNSSFVQGQLGQDTTVMGQDPFQRLFLEGILPRVFNHTKATARTGSVMLQQAGQDIDNAAKRVGCDPSRLRQLRLSGRLPEAIMLGNTWYIPRAVKIVLDIRSQRR